MKHQSGQTLIEVIVAIGLVVLVLITLVSALTLAIRNNQFAKDQVLARNYARESLEWLRSLRNQMEWSSFYDMIVADAPPVTYCLPTLPATTTLAQALGNTVCSATDIIPSTRYQRSILFTAPATDEVDAVVTVQWIDGGKTHQSQSTLILRKWL